MSCRACCDWHSRLMSRRRLLTLGSGIWSFSRAYLKTWQAMWYRASGLYLQLQQTATAYRDPPQQR